MPLQRQTSNIMGLHREELVSCEVEIRARASHTTIRNALNTIKASKQSSSHEHDEYFKFGLDVERRLVLRIRKKAGRSLLTFKGSSKIPEDVAWQEWETEAPDPDALEKLLLSNGLVRVVTIDKKRETYKHNDFEINLDLIEGLGEFVEVELIGDDAEACKQRLEQFLEKDLGILPSAFVKKGYVPLMLEETR